MRSIQGGSITSLLLLCATACALLNFCSVHSFTHRLLPRQPPSYRQYVSLLREDGLAVFSSVWKAAIQMKVNGDDQITSEDYFIRRAMPGDMGIASRILADGFFSHKNFLGYHLEKLTTYLSLESDFPTERDEHIMLVACQSTDGKVVACCDIDNRPTLRVRPYMCNLAVDATWRGKGLAKALIAECEAIVLTEWGQKEVHLKARRHNEAAIALYKSVGYEVLVEGFDASYMDYLVTMKKAIAVLPLEDRNVGSDSATTDEERMRMTVSSDERESAQ